MKIINIRIKVVFVFFGAAISLSAQNNEEVLPVSGYSFLLSSTDVRGSALGMSGVSTAADKNSLYWNAAKYMHMDDNAGIGASLTPMVGGVFDQVFLYSLCGYYKVDNQQCIAGAVRYSNYEETYIQPTNYTGTHNIVSHAAALDISYIHKVKKYASASLTLRYIGANSGLSEVYDYYEFNTGSSWAVDFGFFREVSSGNLDGLTQNQASPNSPIVRFGIQLNNLGPQISYAKNATYALPASLSIGYNIEFNYKENQNIALGIELSKRFTSSPVIEPGRIISENDDNRSIHVENVYKNEIGLSAEYINDDFLFVRTGYHLDYTSNSAIHLFAVGAGFRYLNRTIDFTSVFPEKNNAPVSNFLQLSMGVFL